MYEKVAAFPHFQEILYEIHAGNQDYCSRKRPRKSTTVRSVLHTTLQTHHQLPRGM